MENTCTLVGMYSYNGLQILQLSIMVIIIITREIIITVIYFIVIVTNIARAIYLLPNK